MQIKKLPANFAIKVW